jgi:C4-type Zn-finger protein
MKTSDRRMPCPKCGTLMEYWVEIELGDGYKKIKYYYKCPRCGYRLQDETIIIRRNGSSLVVEREEYRFVGIRSKVGRKIPQR